jgi:uncharacterized protein (UPF0276 family)
MSEPRLGAPDLGVGVGLRVPHYGRILRERPAVDFFEIISENFMVEGGKPRYHLDRVLETYRVIQHGVSLGIGGPEPPDRGYLRKLRQLVRHVRPAWLSDHFCWCGAGGAHLHDLLPMPFNEETVRVVSERARMVQDFLEVRFALENTSSYLAFTASTMTEWEFVSEVTERANVGLMFDVNNVYVSAYNHGFDPYEFVRGVPHERIVQIHLAGHTNVGKYIIDTHRGHVIDPVWDLYRTTIELAGPVSTLIEWDDEIPELEELLAEAGRARVVRDEATRAFDAGHVPAREPCALPHYANTTAEEPAAWRQGGPRETAGSEATVEE